MNIVNNLNIFCMAAGLVAAEGENYTYWNTMSGDTYRLVREASEVPIDEEIKDWFLRAKRRKWHGNPYAPRGFAMHVATHFIEDGHFDLNSFLGFFEQTRLKDPVGEKDFEDWIVKVPDILLYMKKVFADSLALQMWDQDVEDCKKQWTLELKQAQDVLSDFYVQDAPRVIFSPNLLIDYYEMSSMWMGDSVITMAHWPLLESVLYEVLRKTISQHRDTIKAFPCRGMVSSSVEIRDAEYWQWQSGQKTREDYTAEHLRMVEDCFARGISTVMAGGGVPRLAEHANEGFGSVPFIGSSFKESKPKVAQLDVFIEDVLRHFI